MGKSISMGNFIDLTGKKYYKLTVISRCDNHIQPNGKPVTMWECRCDCGNFLKVSSASLIHGRTKSCGCYNIQRIKERKLNNLCGKKFGRLTVIRQSDNHTYPCGNSSVTWECKCDCGNLVTVLSRSLTKGATLSCGCYHKELAKKQKTIHGKHNTRLYRIWYKMHDRCYNIKSSAYKNYGNRGIIICDKWKNDFMSFYEWAMNNGYSDELTIDRINVNGNYEPSNCRWVNRKFQANNRRNNNIITYNNESLTISEWADKINMNRSTFANRLSSGWNVEKSITTPIYENFSRSNNKYKRG